MRKQLVTEMALFLYERLTSQPAIPVRAAVMRLELKFPEATVAEVDRAIEAVWIATREQAGRKSA